MEGAESKRYKRDISCVCRFERNGVGILVPNDILKQLVEVRRYNDRIMLVRIVAGEEIIYIVSAYGPQVGLDEQVKCEF